MEKIPRAESDALITGSTVHEVVASYLEHLIQHSLVTDWTWAEKQGFIDVPADVQEIWSRFYNNFILPPGMEAPAVEKKLAFDRNWQPTEFVAPDAFFRLVVDFTYRQGGLVMVQDWKTNRAVPATVEKDLQLRIYGWGVQQALYPDAQEILLRLHFLRYGAEREILLAPGDLDTVPQELEAKIAVIEAEKHFDPKPGSFCGWCGITAHCPVMAQALVPVEVLAPATREQAEKAATLLLTLQNLEKELGARLKQWVRDQGAIQVGDLVYGPSIATSYDLDPRAVVQLLLGAGLEREAIWPLMNLTKTGLERGLKKLRRQDLLGQVLANATAKTTERIDFRKAKEEL
ncbi:MAG: PD-(D/E)XK nuclease family protein [Proteobacteria bacterium]|nr:PD-(D/E)XK nuclease family protein [Pseudomonadota bacterium]